MASRFGWEVKTYRFGKYEVRGISDHWIQINCSCGKASKWMATYKEGKPVAVCLYCDFCGYRGEFLPVEELTA